MMQNVKDSKDWQTTNAEVVISSVKEIRVSSDRLINTSFYPYIFYRYEINGKTYTNDRITLGALEGGKNSSQELVDKFPVGTWVVVHYDPIDPERSTLVKINDASGLSVLFLPAILWILFILFIIFYKIKRKNKSTTIDGNLPTY